jgi:L-rhamnose-H+ transport protein
MTGGYAIVGLVCVLGSGILQGVFLLPMGFAKQWRWEHSWLVFSTFGMLIFNWLIAWIILPHPFAVYRAVPTRDLVELAVFGLGWGGGAVLFGIGMERLGLSLGYPIIMGLIAALGAFVPLLVLHPHTLLSVPGAVISAGTAAAVAGIVLCSRAAARKDSVLGAHRKGLTAGLTIAVAAGVLSSLPNVGMTFGQGVIASAQANGTSPQLAANAVWAIFFTMGFLVNAVCCVGLILHRRTAHLLWSSGSIRDLALAALMGLLWISSFYSYGIGAARMGPLGPVIAWPLFIACAIGVGNLIGFWRGEWRHAPRSATALLGRGMIVLFSAVALISVSGFLR